MILEKHQPAAERDCWQQRGVSSFRKRALFGRRASSHWSNPDLAKASSTWVPLRGPGVLNSEFTEQYQHGAVLVS